MDDNRIFDLYLLLVLLNFGDVWTTIISLKIGLLEASSLPFYLSLGNTILLKFCIVMVFGAWIYFSLWYAQRKNDADGQSRANKRVSYALNLAVLFYLIVVCNNIFWIIVKV